ncbi:MAG TPA: hypothetical protein VF746_27010 [Longimicrobium sp.]|jgi:hypothetical protein
MTAAPLTGAHPDDGVLLRLLDGEEDAPGAGEHVAACAACRERLDALRRRGARLAAVLARADFPVPDSAPAVPSPDARVIPLRRPERSAAMRPWLRAAAVVALLLGIGVLATPARARVAAWVSERWGEVFGRQAGAPAPAPPSAPAPAPAAAPAAASVRFVPAGSTFTVEVEHAQGAGGLTLVRVAGENATAEVAAGEAELLVLPAGLRIRNAAGSAAEYRVGVPAGVRRVTVRVAGGRTTTVEASRIGAEGRRIGL